MQGCQLASVRPLDSFPPVPPSASSPVRPTPLEALRRFWGHQDFRPLQQDAIQSVLGGRDCLIVLPTGGGKSLCYQVPAVCAEGIALVVSPLIALMDDQVAGARQNGVRAGALHSGLDEAEKRRVRQSLARGELDLLYCSPERLVVGDLGPHLGRLSLIAVDEAHCISHWGHDFRPEYRQLRQLCDSWPDTPRLALTATATPQVRQDIVRQLGLRDPALLVGHPDRPNLVYRALQRDEPVKQIMAVVSRHPGEGGIVYAATRKETEKLSAALVKHGVSAAPYHAGLTPERRRQVQEAFLAEKLDVVTATIAFGMGIDRSNVRWVIHAHLPKSVEHYQQESGRAGRDGLPADCVLLYSAADLNTWRFLATRDGELPTDRQQALDEQLRGIARFAVAPICRHRILSEHFGATLDADSEGCGACDVCLGETTELPADQALITAQKILSAVWRCRERFGASHIVEVLLGGSGAAITRWGHETLTVHGILKEAGAAAVRAWIDQLVVQRHLDIAREGHASWLVLTQNGRDLCKGVGSVRLSTATLSSGKTSRKRKDRSGAAPAIVELALPERGLAENLRALRRKLAERDSVPPYMVFSDATLVDLVQKRPSSRDGLLGVKGIGEHKAGRYGGPILAVLGGGGVDQAVAG